ncbi:hypothetical protein ACFWSF_24530 [Streptomyces sp. NPDC058611]|uniref:hypothetical protein n=1 Tax=unclassified Streptomyces TaxID=2593676 RepID=UPI00365A86FE
MVDDVVTERLHRRIRSDFPDEQAARGVAGALRALVADLGAGGMHGTSAERLAAAVLFVARGDVRRLRTAVATAKTDWRDLLVSAELATADWPTRLDGELGPLGPA